MRFYAIGGTQESASLWKAKGIKPIEFSDYDAIYGTLSEWALCNAARRIWTRTRSIYPDQYSWPSRPMTDQGQSKTARKKTPEDLYSEFEREQLRFFLSAPTRRDAFVNQSMLAWLRAVPAGIDPKRYAADHLIERNFSEVDAIRDVVANIHFFGPDTANFSRVPLEYPRGEPATASAKCRALIIQHMRIDRRRIV
jgi:hypothetical protein